MVTWAWAEEIRKKKTRDTIFACEKKKKKKSQLNLKSYAKISSSPDKYVKSKIWKRSKGNRGGYFYDKNSITVLLTQSLKTQVIHVHFTEILIHVLKW